jgi:hypothetical protein
MKYLLFSAAAAPGAHDTVRVGNELQPGGLALGEGCALGDGHAALQLANG